MDIDAFIQDIPYLSFQQRRMLKEQAQDLALWQIPGKSIEALWPTEYDRTNKNEIRRIFNAFMRQMDEIRHTPVDYSSFNPDYDFHTGGTKINTDFLSPDRIMGKCPCPRDGEQTRCCNLKTLDAVQQCAFACAYCSIQSFYSQNEIRVLSDLQQHLEDMRLEEGTWHIGTGQSSDSLLLGDDYGTLTALASFARLHPDPSSGCGGGAQDKECQDRLDQDGPSAEHSLDMVTECGDTGFEGRASGRYARGQDQGRKSLRTIRSSCRFPHSSHGSVQRVAE